MLPISYIEDDDGPSCVRVPALGLPPALAGVALASLLACNGYLGHPFVNLTDGSSTALLFCFVR